MFHYMYMPTSLFKNHTIFFSVTYVDDLNSQVKANYHSILVS